MVQHHSADCLIVVNFSMYLPRIFMGAFYQIVCIFDWIVFQP
jgi:hypothetical protein